MAFTPPILALQQSGLTAHRDRMDAAAAALVQRPERGLCRLRRLRLPEQLRFLSRPDGGGGWRSSGLWTRNRVLRQPDVAVDASAQQCPLLHRHSPLVQGHQRLHHQPMRGGCPRHRRGGGGYPLGRSRPCRGHRARRSHRARDPLVLPTGRLAVPGCVRPFDHRRSGTILGEGAASLVLEKEPDARARQARVRGEFLGSGCTTEATGIIAVRPDGDGLSRAIELALADANLRPAPGGHGGGARQWHPGFGRVRGDGHPPGFW